MKKNNINKFYIAVVMFFTALLSIVMIVSISFAWYQAKVANSIVKDLDTAGIKIDLNTKDSNTLTPDILKEGVINVTNPTKANLPAGYDDNKETYVEILGNTVTVKEDVKIILGSYDDDTTSKTYTTATFTISMKYLNSNGEVVELTNFSEYFDIKYDMVKKGASYTLDSYNGQFIKKESGDYDLHLSVAYRLPDELLPAYLVNSSCITIYIAAELS